ncbi:hypothetical protein L2E82_26787 [Cichorium intybus]|uniref:Uncharacterized protein n=1 Tax=Cichorium intybus TaxID=13427 RepID=A0ACB9CRA0_CICIN|nr:hypothetical protein L2E82_26787 [Cichorium intybus]
MAKSEGAVLCYSNHHVDAPQNCRSLEKEATIENFSLQRHQAMQGKDMVENTLVEINNIKGDLELENTFVDNETETWYPSIEDSDIWLPPEPDDQEDDVKGSFGNYDDNDDDDDDEEFGDDIKWGKPSNVSNITERFREEKRKAMDEVMSGKFKTLVKNILKSIGISCLKDNGGGNWVDIVTNLSWEAASFLKGEAMDPDEYVKVKCIATGSRSQSEVFNGLVFKKHAAHKHMPTRFKRPKLLLIKGALSGSDGFSSFELMNQEKNRLDSVIEMIEKCNPNVILVEKTVSRDIQESILAKGMTLVLEMKMERLERIARCTGSPILSCDEKLRRCDSFYFEKIIEEHADVCESGKKPRKTLMFLEGLPKHRGCTILLKGSNSDELKKIKTVVQFAVVMAYHLILESSFLLNQRIMFSTISPNIFSTKIPTEEIIPSISNHALDLGFNDSNIPVSKDSNGELETIPISHEPYNSIFLSGLSSLTASLKKVIRFRLLNTAHSISTYFGFNCINPHNQELNSPVDTADTGTKVGSDEEKIINGDQMSKDSLEMNSTAEQMESKDDMNTVLESESILVLMSKRNATRGIICEQDRFSCIKFYRYFDVPLGKFLRDNLLNQKLTCTTCGEPPEAHSYYYAHQNMQLTIEVRHLPTDKHLSGENEGKVWMWSCCGKCNPFNGSLKCTKRVLVSTSACSLSFGKFLELGFSNHSSCDIKSSCGHLFYKDYFHFFGSGSMVAMFRYSLVSTYSVSLPHWKVEFNDSNGGEFLKKEVEDVYVEGLSVFAEVENSLKKMEIEFVGSMLKLQGSLKKFSDVEEMLNQERDRFVVEMKNTANDSACRNNFVYKPLCLNHIQWELLLESCIWDHRLHSLLSSDLKVVDTKTLPLKEISIEGDSGIDMKGDFSFSMSTKLADPNGWMWTPFNKIQSAYMNDLQRGYLPEFQPINSYTTGSKIYKKITEEGSKLHFPVGPGNNYMVSDYEDELSSIIACALTFLKDRNISPEGLDDARSEESHFFSFDSLELLDSVASSRHLHPVVSMGRLCNKFKYSVGCLFANEFLDLRSQCGLSELDFVAALSRCKHWDAKGGKSKSFFAKTLDGRFIIKEIKKTEYYSFLEFASDYFRYMNECFKFGNQTCLAKILGIYQVRKRKSGVKHDLMVMENITYSRNMIRQYDLKGALYARFNSSVGVVGDVLLDQNFVNDMNVSPLYVNRKGKRNLQRAVWNDTVFLNSINVMDYSLLVGVDAEKKELVCGIIDYVRQYTWDKQLENWVKLFVVPKNQLPTVISPKEYKKRFRKFIDTHFLSVPDDWCSQRPSNRCTLCGVAINATSHGCSHSIRP